MFNEATDVVTVQDLDGLSDATLDELRYRCQTDLFFLSNNILRSARSKKAKPLLQKVHGNICQTLVSKRPTSNFGYAGDVPGEILPLEEWSDVKERVILSSRGTLKSVIEAADVVQIILCEPNVRVILMSGKIGAAKSILRMVRSFFMGNDVLAFLFPAFYIDPLQRQPSSESLVTPARTEVELRDPTVQIATFGSVKAGAHGEWLKLDDCTNEINQATPELVEKSKEEYDDLDPLLEPGGYIDFTGTRWAVDDLPEYIINNGLTLEKEDGEKHVVYLHQPVWTVKPIIDDGTKSPMEIAKLQQERDWREKNHRLVPDDVDLLWPEKLTAKYLWPQYRKNPAKFAKQYLLNPELVMSGCFTRKMLERQTKPIEFCPMPHQSQIFINWDLSGLSGKGDFAVGVVGYWELSGRLYIIDATMEKFTSSTSLCMAILKLFKKYNPDYHRIESAQGAELLSGELTMLARQMKLDRAFHPGFDAPSNEKDAKRMRILQLAGAMERDLIQFYEGIDCLEEIYLQFERFTGKGKYKDDGPDCIAQMYAKYKDSIAPKAVGFLTPSGGVVGFVSEGPNVHDKNFKEKEQVDPHADERNADIDFLKGFTVPH